MVRSGRYKYVVYEHGPTREQLFDLEQDPGERVNLAVSSRFRDTLQAHREMVRAHLEETGTTFGGGHYTHPATRIMLPGDDYA